MPACCAVSAMIYYPNGKQWLMQLLIPSIFAFERKNPIDFTHQSAHDCKCLIVGEKVILSLHRCKPKATAVVLLCSQNQPLSLKAKMLKCHLHYIWVNMYSHYTRFN